MGDATLPDDSQLHVVIPDIAFSVRDGDHGCPLCPV